MQPQNPDFVQAVQRSFAKQNMMALIGARLTKIEAGYVEISLPFKAGLTQQHGFLHAGVVTTIADSAGGYAAFSLMPADATVLSIEFKINLLRPAAGELFIAKARVLRAGKQISVCQSEVEALKGDEAKVCAVMQMTMMTVYNLPEQ